MVTLLEVRGDDARLGRLLQLCIHEWSARVVVPIGPDALFTYEDIELYTDRPDHAAFLLIDAEDARTPLGFALVLRDAEGFWHVEEFFVLAGARRRGVGAAAAAQLFAARPGPWTLTVRPENPGALEFWRRVAPRVEESVEVGDDAISRTRLWISGRRGT